ncbi:MULTISPECIES: WYL domain-containing protein [unclassified Acinetobacter]|uniref:helix-turn-helix transcriptional regulator n=1 Tax=unclassified Acinetobacter TaxID=196816 RepID=UPI002934BC05|nr:MULTISPECIES: WYL domain-containing protein [unclassified Acinetobacter]WOE31813.1 WYL domain-containing protein [Acinetobacter sp. SAAs470]WOE37280.1 WYL domain-containing protein [Acinetobacter sp. SAAs474]
MSSQEKETSNTLYRQWHILSRLSTGKWMGTRELQEILLREGIDVSLRTIQRDLNQISQRFLIESNGTVPQGWRWRADAPIQSLPHMTSSQAVTFMMVEEHLNHLLPPSLIEEMNPWFDLARRSLSTQNNVRQWINRVRIVPANQPLIPPVVDKQAQQAIYEGLLQDKQLECIYQPRTPEAEEKSYILNPLALVQKGAVIYLICTRFDKTDIQTFALHRFKSAQVLDSRALHPVNFDIDKYIESGALGFRVDYSKPTEYIQIKLQMSENDAMYFEECQLSQDQVIHKQDNGYSIVCATVPYTSQLIWWLRGFGKKIQNIEPQYVFHAVRETDISSCS